MTTRRGNFIWEELWTAQTAPAAAFYGKVAGLEAEPAQFGASHTTLAGAGGPMGGLLALGHEHKGMRPGWLSFIGTENVDETARQTESLGGKVIVPPADIGNGGRGAVLQDPQGAMFAVYASPHPHEAPATVPLGGIYWHELITTDHAAAFTFYERVFGWTIANDMKMGDMGLYRIFGTPAMPNGAGGMYTKALQQPGPSMWLPYINVRSAEKAAAAAKSLGANITHGPADIPGGRIAIGVDPQGVVFAIHALARSATSPKPKPKPKPKRKPKPKVKVKLGAKRTKNKKAAKKPKRKAGSKK